jgi:hypothetical protein
MRAAGCQVELEIWPRMPHTWQVWARVLPEARAAIERIGAFVESKVEPHAVRSTIALALALRPLAVTVLPIALARRAAATACAAVQLAAPLFHRWRPAGFRLLRQRTIHPQVDGQSVIMLLSPHAIRTKK